ncbi:unnamed protein product [Symbiodinium pilosum]|uniref:Uncharacterized protein n=1 Tax=Symbiodinium pilosum TaxID=2952 RepID=A0A812YC54_SYMPI|nr:unnamed protein product [Symbiodinium pilosum]
MGEDATVDALDLVLDGVDTIWGWVAGSKESDQPRICQPTSQPQMPGQLPGAGPAAGYSTQPPAGFQAPPAQPKTSANHYAAAFGGGVVGANNPVMVGGVPNSQPAPAAYQSYAAGPTAPTPTPAPAAAEPPKPAPAPMVDLLSMEEPASSAKPAGVSDLLGDLDESGTTQSSAPSAQATQNMLDL